MTITFVSNYLNHHQIPMCQAIIHNLKSDDKFTFIQIEDMDMERQAMGWGVSLQEYTFALIYKDNREEADRIILESDVVIFGGVDDESYIQPRLKAGKIIIRYSERLYKEGQWKFITPKGLIKKYKDHIKPDKGNIYLFCAGAYVASDFSLINAYKGRRYSWGYFPSIRQYDDLHKMRSNNERLELLWTGRMIDWKHPEHALLAAYVLRNNGIDFHMTILGQGPLKSDIIAKAKMMSLDSYIDFEDFVKPDKVREYMLKSDIYLFTSDYKEGWGAVLNESMNCGCALIASSGIGAVPYLLQHNINGMVYRTGNIKEMQRYVLELAKDKDLRHRLADAAYATVSNGWTPEIAANRLVNFARGILAGNEPVFKDGPLSKAALISPGKGYNYTRRKNG